MKNIIILVLLGIIGVTVVSAYTNPLQIVEKIRMEDMTTVEKIYDSNNGVTCYVYEKYNGGGISCIK